MSLDLRKNETDRILSAVIAEQNRAREAAVGANFHASATVGPASSGDPPTASAITLPAAATDLDTSLVLCNALYELVQKHFADDVAHSSALSAPLDEALAIDLTTAQDRANAIKAAYNTHRTEASVHFNNDGTNAIAALDATDQSSLNTLLNEMRTDIPAHIAGALAGHSIRLIGA